MSEAISALAGRTFEGYATIRELGLRGMISLRGDLSSVALRNAVTGVTGVDFPGQRQINRVADQGLAWMSPDELLVMVPYAAAPQATRTIAKALDGTHHLVADVSDARASFAIEGPAAREILAKLTPADVSPAGLPPGEIRRSRLAQVAAAFWMNGPEQAELVCFRSVATYCFDLLQQAAQPGGEIGLFRG